MAPQSLVSSVEILDNDLKVLKSVVSRPSCSSVPTVRLLLTSGKSPWRALSIFRFKKQQPSM